MKEWTDYDDAVRIFAELFGEDGRKRLHEKIESGEIAAQALDFSFTKGFGVTRTIHPGVPRSYFWRVAVPVEGQPNSLKIPEEYFDDEGSLTSSPWNEEGSRFQVRDADLASFQKSAATTVAVRKAGGGAPTKYDWASAAGYMAGYIVENDYPTKADAATVLLKWFAAGKFEPDKRDVQKFVAALYEQRKP